MSDPSMFAAVRRSGLLKPTAAPPAWCLTPVQPCCAEHYGFCLENNPDGRSFLPLEAFCLPGLQESLDPGDAWLHPCGTPCQPLLQQLRLLAASPAERRQASCRLWSTVA